MRTRIILIGAGILAVIALLMIGLAGDSDSGDGTAQVNSVVAGFYPLAFAAQEVEADLEVENLTPPGTEPHDLEVSSRDVQELESADLVLLLGRGFQPQLEQAAENGSARVVEVLDTPGLDLLADDDPHVWLDPLRYATVVERVAAALGDDRAARRLVERLRRLDSAFRAGLSSCRRHTIVTSHEAFAYLADRYGLRQISITGLSPEAEPSPADLADVVERVRRSGATTVFSEALLSRRLAETVARETGARTDVLNPIEGLTSEERDRDENYLTLMRRNLTRLRAALGCH